MSRSGKRTGRWTPRRKIIYHDLQKERSQDSTFRLESEVHPESVGNSQFRWFGLVNKMSAFRIPRKAVGARCEGMTETEIILSLSMFQKL